MAVSNALLSAVITLTLVPATAGVAKASVPPRGSPPAQSLALSPVVRSGTKKAQGNHKPRLGVLPSLLVVAGAVPAAIVVQDAIDHASGG